MNMSRSKNHELLFFVDLDDTAINSADGFMRIFANEGWMPEGSYPEYSEHWGNIMGEPPEVVKKRSDYIWQKQLALDFEPLPGAVEALRRLKHEGLYGREITLWGATSRPITSREVTHSTIDRHFAGIITDCVFAGFYDGPPLEEHYLATKEALYREYKPDAVFDDQVKHANGAVFAGVDVPIHFGLHMPIVHEECVSGVLHASDWAEAEQRVRDGFRFLEVNRPILLG